MLERAGVHVSKVETLSLARAKALAELGFSALSLVVAGFIGGQGETFVRCVGFARETLESRLPAMAFVRVVADRKSFENVGMGSSRPRAAQG